MHLWPFLLGIMGDLQLMVNKTTSKQGISVVGMAKREKTCSYKHAIMANIRVHVLD